MDGRTKQSSRKMRACPISVPREAIPMKLQSQAACALVSVALDEIQRGETAFVAGGDHVVEADTRVVATSH
jgi:hypothetical protein